MTVALDYQLTAADLDAFAVHHAAHAPHLRRHNQRMRWVYAIVFGLIAVGYAQFATTGAVIFAVIAVIYLIFYARFNRWWVVRHSRRANAGPDGPTLGPIQLRLTDDQLLIDEPEGNARLAVTAIRRFDESDTHHFIYLGPSAALIVPKAVDGAADFIQALRDGVAARTPPPSPVDHPQT
ncbi:MAG: hypothetical protein CMJ49_12410 [Planctomycetaceae bacterium]|nr:hypothetical protein [Planctomycetaceae bacterium]